MDINKELDKIAKMQVKVLTERRRKKRQRLLVTQVLLDYTKNSTLHGLRYITERRLKNFEKVFWLLTFLLSFFVCLYCISNVYWKWIDSPVIVTVSEKLVPVRSVPFPSVTICPQIKIRNSKCNLACTWDQALHLEKTIKYLEAEQIKWKNHSYSDEINNLKNQLRYESDKFNDLSSMICQQYYFRFDSTIKSNKSTWNGNKLIETIIDISLKPEDIFWECWRYAVFTNCDKLFHRVLTSEGVCYNFNGIAADELFHQDQAIVTNITESNHKIVGWNPETGYDDSVRKPFPYHGHENTDSPDLSVVLAIADEKDLYCNNRNSGFKIYFHNSLDLPQSSLYYYAAIENQVTSLAVNLNVLSTSETLMHYAPEVRQCYFQKEKYLKFFKVYTVKNCQMECLANITLKICKCVGFYMPHIENTTICDSNQKRCMHYARKRMVTDSLEPRSSDDIEDDEYKYCRCLPSCNSVEYDAEVLKTNYDRTLDQMFEKKYGKFVLNGSQYIFKTIPSYQSIKYSRIEIFSKKLHYISMRRSEMLGFFGFVANIGGLLGLFLGFSVLSLIEIFYYLTVRIGVILKRDEKEDDIYATT